MKVNHAVTAVVTGEIRGGGGGGYYGVDFFNPSAGGALDTAGGPYNPLPGFETNIPGNAVRLVGARSFSYSGGGTVGTVGA